MTEKENPSYSSNKIILLILICFFLSGLSGLIYEILWTRMIVKIIGGAPFAVSIILTTFMGGLGLGSFIASRTTDCVSRPSKLVKIYAILQLTIGIYGLAIPVLLTAFKPLYAAIYNQLFGYFLLYNLLTFVGCFILLCIPVICMGATLPVLCRFYVTKLSHVGTHAGRLYGLNTIGAALGALLCGFWLIYLLGMWGALIFAVSVNVIVGLICLATGHKIEMETGTSEQVDLNPKESPQKYPDEKTNLSDYPEAIYGALIIFAVSGFCAMAYEVIWTKLLGLIIGPTTYSFTIVLATFITSLALGSMLFGWIADKIKRPMQLLISTQLTAALTALLISQFLGNGQFFFAKMIYHFQYSFVLLNILKTTFVFVLMLLPTLCLGATFPLVGKIYTQSISKVGRSIGFAYAINTIGAVLGSFSAGFIFIPSLGKEKSLSLIVGLQLLTSFAIAVTILIRKKQNALKWSSLIALASAGLFLCFNFPIWNRALLSEGKYQRFGDIKIDIESTGWIQSIFKGPEILTRAKNYEVVYYGDGIAGFTTVVKHADPFGNFNYIILISGKGDASSRSDMRSQTLFAHLPMLFHKNPRTVMVLGLATGVTAGEVLCYPIEKMDLIEINRQVVKASDYFLPWNNNVLSNPKTNLIIQDARAHLLLTKQKYDVIISEPSNPWMAGLATLFTRDFFSLANDQLNDNGIFVQFIHSYQMDWETFALVGRTFANVFPNSMLFTTKPSTHGTDYLLVGFKGINKLVTDNADKNISYTQNSKNVTLKDARLLYRLIISEDLQRLFGPGAVNTDNWPRLEFSAPKLMYQHIDPMIERNIQSKRWISPETANTIQKITTDIDKQIDFAAYALSLYEPFHGMVDLSKATKSQKERFLKLMDIYCANNPIDSVVFADDKLKQRYCSIQIEAIESKIDLLPDRANSHFYLALLYQASGMLDKAVINYSKSIQIKPQNPKARYRLADCLYTLGRTEQAINQYREVLRLRPNWSETLDDLAWILATSQNPKFQNSSEALKLARKACKNTKYKDPYFMDTYAAALAQSNQFVKAEQVAQKAVDLALSIGNRELARSIDSRRQLYKSRKKFYEIPATPFR